jgi:hypothetical protein
MNRLILLFIFPMVILSCKNDQSGPGSVTSAELSELSTTIIHPDKLTIPAACEMLTKEWIKETLGLKLSDVALKDSDDPTNKNTRSCFFRWEDPATPNAGIVIQIMTNPVYDEFDQWVSYFVNAKLTDGEVVLGNDEPYKYSKFEAGGIKGVYSFDLKRFYWNLGNNYLFMLAFNMDIPEGKMVEHAKKMAAEINNNFAVKVKQ